MQWYILTGETEPAPGGILAQLMLGYISLLSHMAQDKSAFLLHVTH